MAGSAPSRSRCSGPRPRIRWRPTAFLQDYLKEIDGTLALPVWRVKQYDVRANALTERIMLLVTNGLGGLVLVVGILFIFLNARIAFWVAAGIPVAMLATIGMMWVTGQTINMLSLFGLIMMLGVIVDDAIVVGEHTATRFSDGDEPLERGRAGRGPHGPAGDGGDDHNRSGLRADPRHPGQSSARSSACCRSSCWR